MPKVAEGLTMSGTPREVFQVSGGGFIATGATDGEVQEVAEWVRYRIAFYGSTPSYWPVFEHHGLGDLGRKLNRMTKEGQWDRIAAEIPDDVLRLFAAIGRHDELASLVDARFGGSTDMIYASTSSDIQPVIPPGILQDIQRIETPFKGFRMKW